MEQPHQLLLLDFDQWLGKLPRFPPSYEPFGKAHSERSEKLSETFQQLTGSGKEHLQLMEVLSPNRLLLRANRLPP